MLARTLALPARLTVLPFAARMRLAGVALTAPGSASSLWQYDGRCGDNKRASTLGGIVLRYGETRAGVKVDVVYDKACAALRALARVTRAWHAGVYLPEERARERERVLQATTHLYTYTNRQKRLETLSLTAARI